MASRWNSGVSIILLFSFPELLLSAVVTLDSLEIYKNHEWLGSKPKVYFQCSGEKKAALPDVKKTYTVYKFKGEESFQPLTEFSSKKCKRCGFYEEEHIKFDDVFDEWEFCPSDFAASDGRYIRTVDKEFNATFFVAASAIFVAGLVVAYKYWQKRKRQQEQARFLKLFEDTDDVEDELGIDSI
ncbi:hypothetical protein Ccrd_021759 [Cynara cardunculus var. scolymus]|uniref:DUF7953 domain-containing protein n=1 Tax=Cynara cardunculus var. scolymus TaxID=59895 RepID=A0A103XZZ3_CYNCS|nr:hypothetical protein Ccrd_021759 [Cynara cardunculus var. scolymus]